MAIKFKKKGIFFTFSSILLIMVLMMTFKPDKKIEYDEDFSVVKARVNKIDDFINDFEDNYMGKMLETTTYFALTAITYYTDQEDEFLPELGPTFKEVILYGTVNDVSIDGIIGEEIMFNNTLINWTDRFVDTAESTLNVDMNYSIKNIEIVQTNPWFIDIDLIISYSISSETANWTRNTVSIKSKLDTEYLYDPMYYFYTDGGYKKKVKKQDIAISQWNTEKFKDFVENGTYYHWQNSSAPSLLMRFINDTSPSICCGIESTINPNLISPSSQMESYIDYQFWNKTYNEKCSELYNITGIQPEFKYFKLDFDRIQKYNISEDDVEESC